MKVGDCMSRGVEVVTRDTTLKQAARLMAEIDAGFIPVAENGRLIGVITDRDLAIRGFAYGHGAEGRVDNVMSPQVSYCFEDEDVLDNMGDLQVRRLPVLDRTMRLCGIVSLGDLAAHGATALAGYALKNIARPSGLHSQSV